MTLIVHLSDTHFGTEVPAVVNALRDIVAERNPDLVIVSGDITQRAKRGEFAAARQFFASLPVPALLAIPGNHDIPLYDLLARGFFPYRNYCAALGRQSGTWFGTDVAVFGFNSTSPLRHTRGKLSPDHFSRLLKEAPQAARNGIRIGCVHQPLHTAWMQDAHERLIDAEAAAGHFSTHGFDLVLSGHVHVPYIATTRDSFPGLDRHFILSGAGTATSHRTRPGAPNSFNFIETRPHGEDIEVDITLCRFDEEKCVFAPNPAYRFQRAGDGWKEVSA